MTREIARRPEAWAGNVALRGPDAPKNDGSIRHLIEYLLTVYERFGNTTVTNDLHLQWGATALHKRDEQKERIAELEQKLAEATRPEERVFEMNNGHGAGGTSSGNVSNARGTARLDQRAVSSNPRQPSTCRADRDGECTWRYCPQLRDGEPAKSDRDCPLDSDDAAHSQTKEG